LDRASANTPHLCQPARRRSESHCVSRDPV
jgi:hypothetical protein